MKSVITGILVAIAFAGAAMAIKNQTTQVQPALPTAPTAGAVAAGDASSAGSESRVVTVTYFTTDVRCPSCLRIEEWTRQTVESRFPEQVAAGTLAFHLVNTDRPENRHFIEDYRLVSKTVIVQEIDNGVPGEWVNLQEVWTLLSNRSEFESLVAGVVAGML